jgi:hypothetical protein
MSIIDPNEVAEARQRLMRGSNALCAQADLVVEDGNVIKSKNGELSAMDPGLNQQAPDCVQGSLGGIIGGNRAQSSQDAAWIKEREAERAERQRQRDEEMRAMCLTTATQQLHARPADEIVQYAKSLFEFIKGNAYHSF